MKKLTKILTPVLSISAVATAIVPLTVSCGKNGNWINGKDEKISINPNDYTRLVNQEQGWDKITDEKINPLTLKYLEKAQNDGNIINNDFKFSTRKSYTSIYDAINDLNDEMSNPEKEDIEIDEKKCYITVDSVNHKIDKDGKVKITLILDSKNPEVKVTDLPEITLKNVVLIAPVLYEGEKQTITIAQIGDITISGKNNKKEIEAQITLPEGAIKSGYSTRDARLMFNLVGSYSNYYVDNINLTKDAEALPKPFDITVNEYKGKLENVSVNKATKEKQETPDYYLMNLNNGLKLDLSLTFNQYELENDIIPGMASIHTVLDGTLSIKANISAQYNNVLASVKPVGSMADTSNPQYVVEKIILVLMGVSLDDKENDKYILPVVYADMGRTVNKAEQKELGIKMPEWSFTRSGFFDISYKNRNGDALAVDLHFDGNKTFTYQTYDPEETWGGDILTDAILGLTGQWISPYLVGCVYQEAE